MKDFLIMHYLIILRGPPGSGKTHLANYMMSHLSIRRDDTLLDLDEVTPYKFDENISRVLKHDIVIGEMHFGGSHTKEPRKWLEKFEKKYKILSVVLIVGFDECIKNAVCRQEHPLTPSDAIHQYFLFYTEHQHIFNSKARVKEIQLYCKDKTTQQLQDEILNDPVLKDG
jgi:hypothetical protein